MECLANFISAMEELKKSLDAMSCTSAIVDSIPGTGQDGYVSLHSRSPIALALALP